jgi:hypothetical protein
MSDLPYMHHARPWTLNEIEVLKAMYPNTPTPLVAKTMLRSVKSIYGQAHVLGLRKSAEYMRSMMDKCRKPVPA